MKSLLDKMNLRPQERRLVVIVAVVVFIVLNVWLVFPNFGELGRMQQRLRDMEGKITTYEREINNEKAYKAEQVKLSTQGAIVATEAQGLQLDTEVQSQARLSNVGIQNSSPVVTQSGGRTNAFFEEKSQNITVQTGEKELIDFLWNLGEQGTLIRVKSMVLSRDPSQTRLQGNLTLVKSFQRKAPAKPVAAAAKATNAPAAKPPVKDPPKAVKTPEPPKTTNAVKRPMPPK